MRFGRRLLLPLVVAAHAAALLWLTSLPRPPERPTARVAIFLVPLREPRQEPIDRPADRTVRPETTRAVAPRHAAADAASEQASLAAPTVAVATPAASAPASAPPPLDLTVHAMPARSRPLDAVAGDPRSNTHRTTAAERMAQALGADDRVFEEIRPDGTVRIRQGTNCYDARVSQATVLDPYNTAFVPKPRLVSSC